jgi:hypothetical protein
MTTDGLTSATYAAQLGATLPARLRRFVDRERDAHDGRLAALPHYDDPVAVSFTGSELASFVLEDWPDDDEDGEPFLPHPMASELDFEGALRGWVPLATLGMDDMQVLLARVDDPACPVGLWWHEDEVVLPVADSLDAFLAALAEPSDEE